MLGHELAGRIVAGNGDRKASARLVHRFSIGLAGRGFVWRHGLAGNAKLGLEFFHEPDRCLHGSPNLASLWNWAGASQFGVDGGSTRPARRGESAGAFGSGLAGGGSSGPGWVGDWTSSPGHFRDFTRRCSRALGCGASFNLVVTSVRVRSLSAVGIDGALLVG